MDKKQNIKWWWNIPVIMLLVILIPLGVRSIITDDNRFGWGTFSKQTSFSINYYWIKKDGTKQRYLPGKELGGKVRKKLKARGSTRYSVGALESWITNYTRFMYLNKRQSENTEKFRAEVRYRINSPRNSGKPTGEIHLMVIDYPVSAGE